jgi:hypothetical protein
MEQTKLRDHGRLNPFGDCKRAQKARMIYNHLSSNQHHFYMVENGGGKARIYTRDPIGGYPIHNNSFNGSEIIHVNTKGFGSVLRNEFDIPSKQIKYAERYVIEM